MIDQRARAVPHTQRFRRAADAIKLTADQRRRQASVMGVAWTSLRSREAVMQFFNERCESLAARPLDLAMESDEGLAVVEQALRSLRRDGPATISPGKPPK